MAPNKLPTLFGTEPFEWSLGYYRSCLVSNIFRRGVNIQHTWGRKTFVLPSIWISFGKECMITGAWSLNSFFRLLFDTLPLSLICNCSLTYIIGIWPRWKRGFAKEWRIRHARVQRWHNEAEEAVILTKRLWKRYWFRQLHAVLAKLADPMDRGKSTTPITFTVWTFMPKPLNHS